MINYDFLRQMCVVVAREINAVLKRLVARGRIGKYSVCIASDSGLELLARYKFNDFMQHYFSDI